MNFMAENDYKRSIIEFVDNNYDNEISLKLLSDMFAYNTAYLGQVFKTETNEIFTRYLCKKRIRKAIDLILHTNYSINKISSLVGYKDSNYFYKVFKKEIGIYPKEFRERNKNYTLIAI